MAETMKPYLSILRETLDYAFDLRMFPSQVYDRPQVETKESLELVNNPIVVCRNEDERIEIEPSINSVRINIVIKKHSDLEAMLIDVYTNYLMARANKLNIFRKKEKESYDISFLVTNYHLETYKKESIIDYIVEFVQDLTKELTEMKLIVSSQSRLASTNFMEQLKI
jgi:actin related protein 2/3 complex subunit 4